MRTQDLKNRCNEYLDNLISEVKWTRSTKAIVDYLDFCSRFHNYSFHNTLLIWTQRPDATLVAGFRTWQKMGRWIKKGERGIPIFAPMRVKTEDYEEGEEREQEKIVYKVVYVWDVSQTQGKPLPQAPDTLKVKGNTDLFSILEDVVSQDEITVEYVDSLRGAYGVSEMGKIRILNNLKQNEKFLILAHEFAHELLHGVQERMGLSKKIKELEAEATAYVVCRHFGLSTESPTYLALYGVEELDIRASLQRIISTSSRIISEVSRKKEERSRDETKQAIQRGIFKTTEDEEAKALVRYDQIPYPSLQKGLHPQEEAQIFKP